jgi:hypothetical protein
MLTIKSQTTKNPCLKLINTLDINSRVYSDNKYRTYPKYHIIPGFIQQPKSQLSYKATVFQIGDTRNRQVHLQKLIGILYDYLGLPNDWDGYDGVAPKLKTIKDAIALIEILPNSIKLPKPMLGGSGVVGLYWEKNDIYAEICFEGDGSFWYYATDGNTEVGEDYVFLQHITTFPIKLLNIINKI